ncbi:MAG: type ISP restriction/modification enzyme [Rhodospirillales bacterium]|jgi:predicted helicase|nr:type ISP restriction/modification enzyme [Rhodospirillales bacterium]
MSQKAQAIKVVIGNPPYSAGQDSANDNNANIAYPSLDESIRTTYAARSTATLKNSLYNSYIRAFRWASDRLAESGAGVVAFVSIAGWVDGNATDGFRKCLADEFASIYVFHLRGNQRTSGERSRREGGKIFGGGSRAPIAISILVKKPDAAKQGKIYFHDIGDYLTREEKLSTVRRFASIDGIEQEHGWQEITPDEYGDWLDQRDQSFEAHIILGDKKGGAPALFERYSGGVSSGRDAWVYNFSRKALSANMERMIATYNAEVERFGDLFGSASRQAKVKAIDGFVTTDTTKISWTRALKADVVKGRRYAFEPDCLVRVLYRPFMRTWLYYSRTFNEMVLQMPRIFPLGGEQAENLIISVPAPGNVTPFSTFMSNTIFDLSVTAAKAGTQCFPRYIYNVDAEDTNESGQGDLLAGGVTSGNSQQRRDAITDDGLAHFMAAYPDEQISKDDLFYYIYGLLHSEDYRARYADNLSKQLPRIPAVKRAADFWAFSNAGRKLADLHVNYESATPYDVGIKEGKLLMGELKPQDFRVTKMRFGGKGKDKDKSVVIYNSKITMTDIPLEAYDYVVNGKPALEWVMERQCVKTDKDSSIVNDANDYAIETVDDPAYPLKLFQRIITVSLETMKIVKALPRLDI